MKSTVAFGLDLVSTFVAAAIADNTKSVPADPVQYDQMLTVPLWVGSNPNQACKQSG